jgi:stage II sporulation protein AA (anti-sigma F factor antagonist)
MAKNLIVVVQDIDTAASAKLVKLTGEMDAGNINLFLAPIEPLIINGINNFVLDFSGVQFIDSSANLQLVRLHMMVRRNNGSLKLINVNPHIREIFDLMGITQLLLLFNSYEEAIADLPK